MSLVRIFLRGDTASNWTTVNPVLQNKELAIETNTKRLKIGDGATSWNALPYLGLTVGEVTAMPERTTDLTGSEYLIVLDTSDNTLKRIVPGRIQSVASTLEGRVSALEGQVALLSPLGGVLAEKHTSGADVQSAVDVQFDNYAADPTVTLDPGDRLLYNLSWNLLNTSGATQTITSMKLKIAGGNTFQWNSISVPSGGVYYCKMTCEYTVSDTTSTHVQDATLSISAVNTAQTSVAGGSVVTGATQAGSRLGEWLISYQATATDHGSTVPQFEVRLNLGVSLATWIARRLQSSLTIVKLS